MCFSDQVACGFVVISCNFSGEICLGFVICSMLRIRMDEQNFPTQVWVAKKTIRGAQGPKKTEKPVVLLENCFKLRYNPSF